MKRTNRSSFVATLNFLALVIFLSGCIVVVKEDDDERHRHLRGSEWTLEVVFYRTETLMSADRSIQVDFSDNNIITGIASCGEISGNYEVNENGGLTISSVETAASCQNNPDVAVFANSLAAALRYSATEDELTISTRDDGYMAFEAK